MNQNSRLELPFQGQDDAAPRRERERMPAQERNTGRGNGRLNRVILLIVDEQKTAVHAVRQAHIGPLAHGE
jgi:hypothetical protein